MRLNGWHRLFAVFSAAVIVAFGVHVGGKYRTQGMAESLLRDICNASNEGYIKKEMDKHREKAAQAAANAAAAAAMAEVSNASEDSAEALNVRIAKMNAMVEEIELQNAIAIYKERKWERSCAPESARVNKLHHTWLEMWLRDSATILGLVVAGLVGIYMTGWGIAWIGRGFRSSS